MLPGVILVCHTTMLPTSIFILTAYGVILFLGLLCDYVVQFYLKNKPSGMQTFLDKIIQHFMYVHGLGNVAAAVLFGAFEVVGPVTPTIAKIITWTSCSIAMVFLYATYTVLLVRYLSIYHGVIVASLDENIVIPLLYASILVVSSLTPIIEYGFLSDVEDMVIYKLLQDDLSAWNTRMEKSALLSVSIVLIMMSVSQGRIEYDSLKHNHHTGFLLRLKQWIQKINQQVNPEPETNDDESNDLKALYSVSMTRLAFFLGAAIGIAGLAMALFGFANLKVLLVIGTFIAQVILPLLFIVLHKNCRNNLLHKLSHFKLFEPVLYNINV